MLILERRCHSDICFNNKGAPLASLAANPIDNPNAGWLRGNTSKYCFHRCLQRN